MDLLEECKSFNQMYRLPVAEKLGFAALKESVSDRVTNFHKTLADEVDELLEIDVVAPEIDVLVEMADLLGDVCVYCNSEAIKYGIPLDQVLEIIMDSNKSKLDENGNPIYDEAGKVLKGPNYWKPEPKIRALLESIRNKKEKVEVDEAARYFEKSQESAS